MKIALFALLLLPFLFGLVCGLAFFAWLFREDEKWVRHGQDFP